MVFLLTKHHALYEFVCQVNGSSTTTPLVRPSSDNEDDRADHTHSNLHLVMQANLSCNVQEHEQLPGTWCYLALHLSELELTYFR